MYKRMQTKNILKDLNVAAEVCNLLRNKSKSRFNSQTLYVNDIVQCSAKLYLDRISDTSPDCGQLNIMRTGLLWENELVDFMKEKGFYHNLPLYGKVMTSLGILNIIAKPDFLDDISFPDTVIELVTTSYSEKAMNAIVSAQTAFLRALGITVYEWKANEYKVFHNSMIRLAIFLKALEFINPNIDNIQLLYIFLKDGIKSFKFVDVTKSTGEFSFFKKELQDFGSLDHYYEFFLDWINFTLYALRESFKGYDDKIFTEILKQEITSSRILNGYQCNVCPYRQQGRCPSIPPIKKWSRPNIKQMMKFKTFWKQKGIELPKLPEIREFKLKIITERRYFQDPTKNKAWVDRVTGKTIKERDIPDKNELRETTMQVPSKTEWKDTVAWVKEVRAILDSPPLPMLFDDATWFGFLPENIKL